MATITLRLDDWTRDEIERLAQARGTTLSNLLRAEIDELLGKDVEVSRPDVPRSMNLIQRRTLALQHEILARLSSDEYETSYHRRRIRVLESGFTAEYSEEFHTIGPEFSPSECSLVWDILDMFRYLEASVARLGSEDLTELGEDAARRLSFRGFDANDEREVRLLEYTKYLIADDKWTDLADHLSPAQDLGNSHMPMLATYQRMLGVFTPIQKSKISRGRALDAYNLSVAELRQVLDA